MKKIILTLAIAIASAYGYSQQTDSRLLSVYSETELNQIKQKDLANYNALIHGIENATYVVDLPKGKELPDMGSINLPSQGYSYASLGIKILEDQNQYFRINNSNKMLVVKSLLVLKNELLNK